jgi:mitotic spindle assembly checkpoint protein MAD1
MELAHRLEEHGADSAIQCQHEAELAAVQAREVDARATADAPLQATRAAEDRATRDKRTAALARREVGFLKALNVRPPRDYSLSLSSLGSWSICHERTSYASEEAVQSSSYIDEAKEQHIKELESLVSKYKAHIRSLDMEVQELAKRPMLDKGSGLQASSLARGIN